MILQLLLISLDLLLHPVQRLVERSLSVRALAVGNKIVLMLGVDKDLALHQIGCEIEGKVDGRDPFKVRQEFLGLTDDCFLNVGPQTSVSTSDLNLH